MVFSRARIGALGGLLAVVGVALPACGGPSERRAEEPPRRLGGVTDVREIAQLTGPDSANRTDRVGVAGQDLGSMFRAFGQTWFVFGDTFGQRDEGMTGGGGTQWRSNVLAHTTDTDPTDGITFDGYLLDEAGQAREIIPSKKIDNDEMTTIPTYGFETDGAMYLAFMSVRHWGEPGEWETNHAGLARSADRGRTWSVLESPRWPGDSNFVQVSVAHVDSDLYFWGVTHGRFGGVALMKVPTAEVEDQSAYRYFAGDDGGRPRWSDDPGEARTIVDSTVGELSVVHNRYLDRWLMTYTHGDSAGTEIRESATPWGPWGPAFPLRTQQDVPGLYAPYLLPDPPDGPTIYFSLSKWDPYNVFWYRADLVRVD